jgi:hypothetical protein
LGATAAAPFSSADAIGTAAPQPSRVNAVTTATKKQFNRIEKPFSHKSKTERRSQILDHPIVP